MKINEKKMRRLHSVYRYRRLKKNALAQETDVQKGLS